MEQVIQWGMLSETSIVTNVYEINPYKHLLLKLSLLLARPTLGPYVAVILGDLRRFKATSGKFGQNVARLSAI